MRQVDHFLDGFFNPRSVAVVGATNNMLKVNFRLIQNLVNLGFQGQIYPINPVANEILGLKAFAQLKDVPDGIDLAVSAVPAHTTMDIVRQCLEKGIRQLVIITGGFSEGGESGKELHKELAHFVRENGIRTLGPNTLSPINTANNFAISYNHIRTTQRGGVSFGFQSGFYEPKINWVLSNFRVNKILDMGNKVDINEVDALEYFASDPDTRTIAIHLESIRGDARRFFEVLSEVSMRKPTIILKSGRTPGGSLAAASHTGSIARENDLIFDGMIKQTAAIRAQSQDEFFDLAKAFEYLELPQGNHVAIIMMSGGEGVMAADACEMSGMKTAQLNSKTYDKLKPILPPWDIPLNPFDAGVSMEFHISSPHDFFEALSAIPADDDVHCALMQMPPNLWDFMSSDPSFSEEMVDAVRNEFTRGLLKIRGAGKPFALWRSTMDAQEKKWVEELQSHDLPVFQSSERAVRALAAMHRFRSRISVA